MNDMRKIDVLKNAFVACGITCKESAFQDNNEKVLLKILTIPIRDAGAGEIGDIEFYFDENGNYSHEHFMIKS